MIRLLTVVRDDAELQARIGRACGRCDDPAEYEVTGRPLCALCVEQAVRAGLALHRALGALDDELEP